MKKKHRHVHDFEMSDKWLMGNGKNCYEFYCKRCTMIRTVTA
jgi:hypothetical protein